MSITNLSQMILGTYRVSFPGLGIEDGIEISRVAFRLGSIEIYWYGLMIALGVLLAMYLSVRHAPQFNLKPDDVLDYFLWTIPVGIVGARIYYVVFAWDEFSHNIWSVFDTRNGGLAFYGGIITGALSLFVIGKVKKIEFKRAAHFFIPYVALGQAIGRWGNFFNQEAFGTNTSMPWGMYSNGTRNYLASLNDPSVDPNLPVHTTLFYEFIGNLVIYFTVIKVRKKTKEAYEPLAWYLVLYGTLRFFVERIRTDSLYIGNTGIRVSALLSFLMVVAGVAYLLYIHLSSKRTERRAKMAALLTASPEAAADRGDSDAASSMSSADLDAKTDTEDETDQAHKQTRPMDEDEYDHSEETLDDEDKPLDMERVIREARVAADRALSENKDANNDASDEKE